MAGIRSSSQAQSKTKLAREFKEEKDGDKVAGRETTMLSF
jgi:hypothetical protein